MSISFLTGRVLRVARAGLGDVDGQVADALEVGVDLDGGDDRPQVDGHRLVQRQQREAPAVDLDVQRVERLVAGEHARSIRSRSRSTSPLTARRTCFFGEAAHFEQPRLELLELFLEVPDDARPVPLAEPSRHVVFGQLFGTAP